MMTPPVIAIVGPTASGKSSLAERVALELSTSIVSVDAMQVYKGMDIGTAKSYPSSDAVKLYMVDVAELTQDYSVTLFQRDARRCIDIVYEIRNAKPIGLVGDYHPMAKLPLSGHPFGWK